MTYWIHVPAQPQGFVMEGKEVFFEVEVDVVYENMPGRRFHLPSFLPGASLTHWFQFTVHVPDTAVGSFEAYLEGVRVAGLVFEVIGRSE